MAAPPGDSSFSASELPTGQQQQQQQQQLDEELCWCTMDYKPVCAGGKTYSNACRATCAGAKQQSKGECAEEVFGASEQQGAGGAGGAGQALLPQGAGQQPSNSSDSPTATPAAAPCNCSPTATSTGGGVAAVCGQDGSTYQSPCLAGCAGIRVVQWGACEGGPAERPLLIIKLPQQLTAPNANSTVSTSSLIGNATLQKAQALAAGGGANASSEADAAWAAAAGSGGDDAGSTVSGLDGSLSTPTPTPDAQQQQAPSTITCRWAGGGCSGGSSVLCALHCKPIAACVVARACKLAAACLLPEQGQACMHEQAVCAAPHWYPHAGPCAAGAPLLLLQLSAAATGSPTAAGAWPAAWVW
jgi:hypothetical protein